MTDDPQISLIIPTLNEAENLPLLVPRIARVLSDRTYEVIIVDDNSRDDTTGVCAKLASKYPVKLLVRTEPRNGLSGAVLHGMAEARGELLVVMDADLQHPPEKLSEVLAPLEKGDADFVIGSRYMAGGSTEGEWGLFRKLNSKVATILARPFSGKVADPMSGFFALRRATYAGAQRLTPLGYKIGLELMSKCRVRNVREVPIHFGLRAKGESKLSLKQQFKYLEHLSRLYDFSYPRLSPIVKFGIVTAVSWIVGAALFLSLLILIGPALATALSYVGAIVTTAIFHARYARTQREFLVGRHPWRDFLVSSLAEWLACTASAFYLASRIDNHRVWEIFLISFTITMMVRYILRKELLLDIRGLRPALHER